MQIVLYMDLCVDRVFSCNLTAFVAVGLDFPVEQFLGWNETTWNSPGLTHLRECCTDTALCCKIEFLLSPLSSLRSM